MTAEDYECCASGSCEVCRPWAHAELARRLDAAFDVHPDWCKCQRVCGGDQ